MEGAGMKGARPNLQTLFIWGARKIGAVTGVELLLLLVSMSSVAYGLTLVVRGLTPGFSVWIAASGLLAGWLLARSRQPVRRSGMLIFFIGLALLVLHLGSLEGALLALLLRANTLALDFFQGPAGSPFLLESARSVGLALGQLAEMLGVLLERMAAYFAFQLSSSPAFDPMATLLIWGMALWLASAWAAWGVRRLEKPLAALLPGGVLLSACLSYSRASPSILLPFLAAALLLILLEQHQSQRRAWEATNTDFSEELGLDIALLAVPLAAMILATAAFSPNISPRRIGQLLQEALSQPQSQIRELGDSLGLVRATAVDSRFENQRSPGMPRQHLLGSGPELSEQVVMEISSLEIEGLEEDAGITPEGAARLHYWRSLTYDIYTGSGWTTGRPETVSYRAGQLARPPGWDSDTRIAAPPNHLLLTQEIEILAPGVGTLYAVGTVLTADADYQLAWRPFSEQAGADIFGGSVEATHYRVRSWVPYPAESLLRTAGSLYPEAVRNRYLGLPDSLPQRVHALALELTATLPTPYDRALEIESYLRDVPYSLDVPLPPRDADAIDYYLFELQQGYCDYAASAMVVLARAAGIPARLVTGYAGGSYDPTLARVIVTEADAHSWAELYFPGSGWVEFEPTGGRPGLEYGPEGAPPIQANVERQPFPSPANRPGGYAWLILAALLAVLALCLLGWQLADRWRLEKMTPQRAVLLVYDRFYHISVPLTSGSTPAHTPNEFAARFTAWMEGLSASTQWGKRLAVRPPEVRRLTELYNRAVYSPSLPGPMEQELAIQAWNSMRWRLWLLRLFPRQVSKRKAHE